LQIKKDGTKFFLTFQTLSSQEISGKVVFNVANLGNFYVAYILAANLNVLNISQTFQSIPVGFEVTLPSGPGPYLCDNLEITWKAPNSHSLQDTIGLYYIDGEGFYASEVKINVPTGDTGKINFNPSYPYGSFIIYYTLFEGQIVVAQSLSFSLLTSNYYLTLPNEIPIAYKTFPVTWHASKYHNSNDRLALYTWQEIDQTWSRSYSSYLPLTSTGTISYTLPSGIYFFAYGAYYTNFYNTTSISLTPSFEIA